MRRILFSSCHLKQDETFVNPVFYGKMESLNDLWDVTITPTTFDMDNRHGATWHEDCEMWKNEPDEVVLRCTHQLNKEQLEMQSPEDVYGIRTEEHNTYVMKIRPPEEQIYKGRTRIIGVCLQTRLSYPHSEKRSADKTVKRYQCQPFSAGIALMRSLAHWLRFSCIFNRFTL